MLHWRGLRIFRPHVLSAYFHVRLCPMSNPAQALRSLQPAHDFFIAIDSDGCAFDTMEIKHKECFCPQAIKHFDLQAVSKYAREAWEFVNLYSKKRGVNRFPALLAVLDLLRQWERVRDRHVIIRELPQLRAWVSEETRLGNPALRSKIDQEQGGELPAVLAWSEAVNEAIADMVHGVPPFPLVVDSLACASERADMIVASGTPVAALQREWQEHGIARFVRVIAGQETGSKTEHLTYGGVGKYSPNRMLMVGDAYGDLRAARSVDALFYPILPGREEESWDRFFHEALGRFFALAYAGSYQDALVQELDEALPSTPPWSVTGAGLS